LSYLAFILVVVVGFVLYRTPLGVALRACGDNPAALTVQGRSVHAVRIGADMAGAALMAIGGACLTLAAARVFSAGMVGGRGWLCLALVICARWRLSVAVPSTLFLGAIDAYEGELRPQIAGMPLGDLLPILPFVLVIVALALFGRRHYAPAALLVPYAKGRRDRDQ
jgi:simple sugar transport system permease protein